MEKPCSVPDLQRFKVCVPTLLSWWNLAGYDRSPLSSVPISKYSWLPMWTRSSRASILFQIRTAPESCLCPLKGCSYAKKHRFHAYDSSRQSPCEILPWSVYKRYGYRIKVSRIEVCLLKWQCFIYPDYQPITQIELLDSQLFEIKLEMTNLVTYLNSVLITIPGIGTVNGRMILSEIGDIHRFSTP